MPLFLSHVAVKIQGLRSIYIVYGAKGSGHVEKGVNLTLMPTYETNNPDTRSKKV